MKDVKFSEYCFKIVPDMPESVFQEYNALKTARAGGEDWRKFYLDHTKVIREIVEAQNLNYSNFSFLSGLIGDSQYTNERAKIEHALASFVGQHGFFIKPSPNGTVYCCNLKKIYELIPTYSAAEAL